MAVVMCCLATCMAYYSLFIHDQAIVTRVGVVLEEDGRTILLVTGSDRLDPNVDYDIYLQVTFVDSWSTATSGLLSFQSVSSTAFIRPYPYSLSIWILWRLVGFPAQAIGAVSDTLCHEVQLAAIKGTRGDDVTRVSIRSTWHMADIKSVSGHYRAVDPNWWIPVWTVVSLCVAYGNLGRCVLCRIFE